LPKTDATTGEMRCLASRTGFLIRRQSPGVLDVGQCKRSGAKMHLTIVKLVLRHFHRTAEKSQAGRKDASRRKHTRHIQRKLNFH
jgi:hypothetical protein